MWYCWLIVAFAFAGCGGGNSQPPQADEPAPTATPTALATASAEPIGPLLSDLCRDVNKNATEYDQRTDALLAAEKYDELADYLRDSLKQAAEFDAKVEALDPPPDERAAFRRYVEANQRLRRLLAQVADAISVRDFGKVQDVRETSEQVSQARLEAALDLGADECGS